MKLPSIPTHLAIVKRSIDLALALIGRDYDGRADVLAVQLTRIGRNRQSPHDYIRAFARDYGVASIVVEPQHELWATAQATGLRIGRMTMDQAKQCLLGGPATDRQTFCQLLLARDPRLKRLVTILRGTGNVALTDRGKMTRLYAVALGLAYADSLQTAHPVPAFTL